MSYFECSKCGCAEDTALCYYWSAKLRQTPMLCSACDPKIAKWHGHFPQEPAQNWINYGHGQMCHRSEVESWLGQPIEIVGVAGPRSRRDQVHPSFPSPVTAAASSRPRFGLPDRGCLGL